MARNNQGYKKENEQFLIEIAKREGVTSLAGGVLYEVISTGKGSSPRSVNAVATVYYKGTLINGKVFDDNTRKDYPDAFRINELIAGWQIALLRMHVGDKWRVYIPARLGYGDQFITGIPKNSTLIFEIELTSCA